MRAHVCQDDYGLWFVTLEGDDGSLQVVAHNTTREHAIDEAHDHVDREHVLVEDKHTEFPPGGVVPGGLPDGYKPEPRKVQ